MMTYDTSSHAGNSTKAKTKGKKQQAQTNLAAWEPAA